jgi:DNA modification methylase
MNHIKIYQGNCLETLKNIPDGSINTCITSPPYFGLRDYGTAEWVGGNPNCEHTINTGDVDHLKKYQDRPFRGDRSKCLKCDAVRKDNQFGLENTPEEFVKNLVELFREVRRVLKDDGTLWVNLGDSYGQQNGKGFNTNKKEGYTHRIQDMQSIYGDIKVNTGLPPKNLLGMPWRVAFALQADGWILRQDIIWHKPDPMPESVRDRCTKAHEYIFLLSKQGKYYYDNEAIKEMAKYPSGPNSPKKIKKGVGMEKMDTRGGLSNIGANEKKNKRSVWQVQTESFKDAHFATYPKKLIEPCILAACPEGGTVLDPFGGSGTTGVVAVAHNRNAVLCELNQDYIDIMEKRFDKELGMFHTREII